MARNGRAWSHEDTAVLSQLADNDDWLEAAAALFPNHSEGSLKTKISKLRSELGIRGRRGAREEDQDRMNAKSVVASQALLEATLRVGRWS
jgi:hypothetical protein